MIALGQDKDKNQYAPEMYVIAMFDVEKRPFGFQGNSKAADESIHLRPLLTGANFDVKYGQPSKYLLYFGDEVRFEFRNVTV